MITATFKYIMCKSLDEAFGYLSKDVTKYKIIAGGTDVVVQLNKQELYPQVLLDISRVPNGKYIKEENGFIEVGFLVTHSKASLSKLLQRRAMVLSQACSLVGSPQVRNMGTLVGNVVSAQPAADSAVALHCLDAELKVLDCNGYSWVKIADTYIGLGNSKLQNKVVSAIRFKALGAAQGSSFQRVAGRESMALPILNLGVTAEIKDGFFSWARICAAPVAHVPLRLKKVEEFLKGKLVNEKLFKEAGDIACKIAEPRDSLFRGSKGYRKRVIGMLLETGLREAVKVSANRK